jgi:hypothetical protein
MPIVNTVSVSHEIKSLLFVQDGSLNIVLTRTIDGKPDGEESFRIEAVDTAPLLDIQPGNELTVRQQIIASVYQYLLVKGLVVGSIQT